MTMAAPLTPEQKELCILAAELEADISEAWISFYNSTSGQNEIFDAADRGPDRAPILLILPEASHGDRKLAVRVPQLVRALLALCRWRKDAIVRLENEIRHLKGEPDLLPQPARGVADKDYAAQCAMACDKPSFRQYLHDIHGVDISDRERIANRVRTMLKIKSRAELNIDPAAAARWRDLVINHQNWERGR